jgi:hypothetical protein
LPNVELSYTYTNYNRGETEAPMCFYFPKILFQVSNISKKKGLANKSGFYKQTKPPPKKLIKKGCTPQQINGNYKDRYLCSIITIGKKAPLL